MSIHTIHPLRRQHCQQTARLHMEGIATGFISSLGPGFVAALYDAIAEDPNSFGFAAVENDRVLGFVAFTTNLSKLYRYVALKKGLKFAVVLIRRMCSFQALNKVWDNVLYPSKMKKMDLPDAELLSIAVAPEGRGKGIAQQLVDAGMEECRKRRIEKVKVLVADFNEPANKLYQKTGFQRVCQITSHGVLSNIYMISPADHSRQP
jgi:ribosomal protein S18 acetylase RimI-like enzyme